MRFLHISDNEIRKQAKTIFEPILHGESAIGLCYPCCKIAYNLSSFLQRPSLLKKYLGPYYKRYEFITITLEKNESLRSFYDKISFVNSSSLISMCRDIIKRGREPYFFILQADLPSTEILDQILSEIHSCIIQSEKVGGMVFFETNAPSSNTVGKILQENNKFLQNVLYFPTYSKTERGIFLMNLSKNWNITPSQKLLHELSTTFGGSLWLLREALRCYKDHKLTQINAIIVSPGIRLRIETILNQLTSSEKKYLIQIHHGNINKVPEDVRNYFLQTGMIEKHQNKWNIAIPVLISYLEEIYTTEFLTIKNGNVLFHNKDVSSSFTPQEKMILIVLYNRKGTLVSRELLAKALWKEKWEEQYSDWAIDKVISRLRHTLISIGASRNTIQVKKGRGVQITT